MSDTVTAYFVISEACPDVRVPQTQVKESKQVKVRLKKSEKEKFEIKKALYEPPRDKTNKVTVCPAKTRISLGIGPV